MLLTVVRVYHQGRKLSERELREAEGVVGDVRTQIVQINGKAVRQVVCMGQTTPSLPPLIEPQLTGMSPLAPIWGRCGRRPSPDRADKGEGGPAGCLYGPDPPKPSATDRAAANWDESSCPGPRRLRGSANSAGDRVLPPRLVVQDAMTSMSAGRWLAATRYSVGSRRGPAVVGLLVFR